MFEDLQDLYQETILAHGRHPTHARRLEVFDATAKGDNPMCGDRVQVWVRRGPDGRIAETGFEARGCAISIASADLMAEAVNGHRSADVRALFSGFQQMVQTGEPPVDSATWQSLLPLAGVHEFPSRVKCATLPWQALVAALNGATEASNG